MSIANKGNKKCAFWEGKIFSKEHAQAISKGQVQRVAEGRHHLYKDGAYTHKNFDKILFKKTIRKEVLARDNGTCQMCGAKENYMHVDHIQPWAEYVELRFSMDNCRTLCEKCHYKVTYKKEMPGDIKAFGTTFKNRKGGVFHS